MQKSLLCVCAIQPNILGHVAELLSDTWTLLVAIFDCLSSTLYYCSQSWLQLHRAPLQVDHMTHCTDTSLDLVTCVTSHMREDCHFWAEVLRATTWSATFSLPPPRRGQCCYGLPHQLGPQKKRLQGLAAAELQWTCNASKKLTSIFANH